MIAAPRVAASLANRGNPVKRLEETYRRGAPPPGGGLVDPDVQKRMQMQYANKGPTVGRPMPKGRPAGLDDGVINRGPPPGGGGLVDPDVQKQMQMDYAKGRPADTGSVALPLVSSIDSYTDMGGGGLAPGDVPGTGGLDPIEQEIFADEFRGQPSFDDGADPNMIADFMRRQKMMEMQQQGGGGIVPRQMIRG